MNFSRIFHQSWRTISETWYRAQVVHPVLIQLKYGASIPVVVFYGYTSPFQFHYVIVFYHTICHVEEKVHGRNLFLFRPPRLRFKSVPPFQLSFELYLYCPLSCNKMQVLGICCCRLYSLGFAIFLYNNLAPCLRNIFPFSFAQSDRMHLLLFGSIHTPEVRSPF